MRKAWTSILLASLMLGALVYTVYSQRSAGSNSPQVQVLQGGVEQQVPIDVTLLISTETGVQTVTVPLNLHINLMIGPLDAVDLNVDLQPAEQFISPITSIESVRATEAITASDEITASESVTE